MVRAVSGALVAGSIAAVVGVWAWVLANHRFDVELGWLAVPVGLGIGLAVAFGSGRLRSPWICLVGVGLGLVATSLASNFLQRELLYDGIDSLQGQWASLQVELPAAGTDEEDLAALRPEGDFIVPPPAIVRVLPAEGYETMEPEVLAIVWEDVPPATLTEVRALYPDKVAQAEEIIASGDLPDLAVDPTLEADGPEGPTLEEAKARYQASEDEYDIPRPVAECATPPDFTEPTAQAGLGFGDGVPLFLPLADLLIDEAERGDGQEYEAPSPACFAIENAKDQPVETASWLVAILAAGLLPWWLGRRVEDDDRPRADDRVSADG